MQYMNMNILTMNLYENSKWILNDPLNYLIIYF